ncbi:DUF4440 domain-containing protein [Reyranella soli]|uniref:DUF4440 domain-containing protein n=1 Tax=Reyranella soli TaxID=1230389 RepID=A0A512NPZ1_9HYPH|nr:DUF4440 domain-containing protein [Reyranella soli]GEP61009.1 hypothetical protein RSO01_81750 [Reyranella soli]
MRRRAVCALGLPSIFVAASVYAQAAPKKDNVSSDLDARAQQALVDLNKQFAVEEQQGDEEKWKDVARKFFEDHLSEHLLFRRANGQVVGKSEFLNGLMNNPFDRRVAEGISVSLQGNRALVTLVIEATRKDDKSTHRYRNIRMFSRASDQWIVEFWYNYEITGI